MYMTFFCFLFFYSLFTQFTSPQSPACRSSRSLLAPREKRAPQARRCAPKRTPLAPQGASPWQRAYPQEWLRSRTKQAQSLFLGPCSSWLRCSQGRSKTKARHRQAGPPSQDSSHALESWPRYQTRTRMRSGCKPRCNSCHFCPSWE